MDKYEYKVRADEIKTLVAEKDYVQAAEIADTIDWRRVKSVMMLCMVSDLYKVNRRYEDAKNMLLLAYERRPGGRTICYSLCELCIKTEEFVQAWNYYKEFSQAAPKDSGRYILMYKLYEAQEVSLEERINVLEELKKRDYREKWAYELAYLYHRRGLATRCVEECDELILWFGEGKYVIKAMELKMLHQPLTPSQQQIYDHRFDEAVPEENFVQAESMEMEEYGQEDAYGDQAYQPEENMWPEDAEWPEMEETAYQPPEAEDDAPAGEQPDFENEMDIQVKTMDVGRYNTINLQAELAAGLQEVLGSEETSREALPEAEEAGETEPVEAQYQFAENAAEDEIEDTEVFFGETGEMDGIFPDEAYEEEGLPDTVQMKEETAENAVSQVEVQIPEEPEKTQEAVKTPAAGQTPEETSEPDRTAETVMDQMRTENADGTQAETALRLPREMAEVLSQGADGQISFVLPDNVAVEKQITGQMKIEDILTEWERVKKENEEKCKEKVRQHVLRQTGPMFTEFEAAVRDGLLEKLEQGTAAGKADPALGASEQGEETGVTEYSDNAPTPGNRERPGNQEYDEAMEALEELEYLEAPDYIEENGAPGEPQYPDTAEEGRTEEPESDEPAGMWGEEEYPEEPGSVEEGEYPEESETPEGQEYLEEPAGMWEEEGYPEEPGSMEYGEYPEEAEYSEEFFEVWEEEEYPEESGIVEEGEYPEEPGIVEEGEYPEEPGIVEEGEYLEEPGIVEAAEYLEEPGIVEEEEYPEEPGIVEEGEYPEEAGSIEEAEIPEEAGGMETTGEESGRAAEEAVEKGQKVRVPAPDSAEAKEKSSRETKPQSVETDKAKVRAMTKEEKELFAPFIQSRHSREQLVKAIDGISMAAYTGNVVITGEEGMDTLTLAKNMIRDVSMTDSNFSGKVAKITGQGLNQKNVRETLEQLHNGALIIQKAAGMDAKTAAMLHNALQQEKFGIIVILEDTKKAIQKLFLGTPELYGDFTARMDLEALSNDVLVSFGRRYAREKEYSIDDLGVLALHTRIEECQTIDHVVTVIEVKQIVDDAIRHASRKTLGHFFDILRARRYDDEDMIILTEKDFVA